MAFRGTTFHNLVLSVVYPNLSFFRRHMVCRALARHIMALIRDSLIRCALSWLKEGDPYIRS